MTQIQLLVVFCALFVTMLGIGLEYLAAQNRKREKESREAMKRVLGREEAYRKNLDSVWHDSGRVWRG